jgi:L-asparaginase II
VATPSGALVGRLGDPEVRTFLRSAAKPFQAVPLVQAWQAAGAAAPFELSDADLALLCGSHSGGPEHVEAAASLLERGGLEVADLACGTHWPLGRGEAERLRQSGAAPGPLHNNCSGKHAGMLLACRLLDLPVAGYLDPAHPLQRRIRSSLGSFCRLGEGAVAMGVDGCGAPTFHVSVAAAARGWAALADPGLAGLEAADAGAAARLVGAMASRPRMLAGEGRFTTRLGEVTAGRVVGKEGAEGVYALAVRGPVALGVVFKIADGGERARDLVALELLRQTGSLAAAELEDLEPFYRPRLTNHRDEEVGTIVPEFELEEV